MSHSKNLSNIASADLLEPGKDCLSGFASALSHLALLAQERTRSVTAKNPTASKGTGGMARSNSISTPNSRQFALMGPRIIFCPAVDFRTHISSLKQGRSFWPSTLPTSLSFGAFTDGIFTIRSISNRTCASRSKRLGSGKDMTCAVRQFRHLVSERLVSWEKQDSGVERTQCSDGTDMQVDSVSGCLFINGQTITKPPFF